MDHGTRPVQPLLEECLMYSVLLLRPSFTEQTVKCFATSTRVVAGRLTAIKNSIDGRFGLGHHEGVHDLGDPSCREQAV